MGTLMIKCPNTGCEISTGIQTDRFTFRHTPVFFARTLCPICQTQHEWFAKSAWVREPNIRGEQPLNLALIDRRPPSAATHSFKSSVITAIVTAGAIAAGFVAGSVALDAFASARPSALVRLSENAAGALRRTEQQKAVASASPRLSQSAPQPSRRMRATTSPWRTANLSAARLPAAPSCACRRGDASRSPAEDFSFRKMKRTLTTVWTPMFHRVEHANLPH